jgi:hypothetical protein
VWSIVWTGKGCANPIAYTGIEFFNIYAVVHAIAIFFNSLRRYISTDGALWYSDACKWLRLKHFVYKIEMKNLMERFIQQVKDRTECFDDHFPCRMKDCDRQHIMNWFKMYILYLHLETNRIKFTEFLLKAS